MPAKQKLPQDKIPALLSLSSGIILTVFGFIGLFFETILLSTVIFSDIIPFSKDIPIAVNLSLSSGIIIFLTSIFLLRKPNKSIIFGIVIITFSIIACFGMGIFTIGGIIGITGGVFVMLDESKK